MTEPGADSLPRGAAQVSLATIVREWTRIGCIGFGGPPTHIALLRRLCVDERQWIPAREFEDGVAATNLLPGPASTQLAIFCAWRLRGTAGAVVGGLCFITPGLVLILVLAAVFLSSHPPEWILGAAAGAGAAVPAVAVNAASGLVPASWMRIGPRRGQHLRWLCYALAGGAAAAVVGPYLVLVLVACGLAEIVIRREHRPTGPATARAVVPALVGHVAAAGGLGALVWVAFKVGALSYGGGFVIVPLMQHDAVTTYHWMTGAQFLNAVALGQVTPGPVVQTVAVVGYAAGGVTGGLLAALVAFAPSFCFVLFGGPRFDQIRANSSVQAFLTGAGPAVIGAIAGSAIPLGLALGHLWQLAVLGLAAVWLLALRRGVVIAIIGAGALGVVAVLAGAPFNH
ncbi:MAG: chromate efflux transporter [Actinomycetota bacterium]|nr:chromate efflux transporter [Actinomycetota bacterium]